jgi:hypothetical protein
MKLNLNIEEIFEAATPEQKILWNDIFLKYGERISITQLNFNGAIAGTEFLNYVARKMYLGYSVHMSAETGAVQPAMTLYDEANAINDIISAPGIVWDVTAVALKYVGTSIEFNDVLFSRLVAAGFTYFSFIGYRLNY